MKQTKYDELLEAAMLGTGKVISGYISGGETKDPPY